MIAGTLNVGNASNIVPLYIGSLGKGEFRQQSGDVTITRNLTLG
jgi:hypothetical protein